VVREVSHRENCGHPSLTLTMQMDDEKWRSESGTPNYCIETKL
jgi:hypothetical protein